MTLTSAIPDNVQTLRAAASRAADNLSNVDTRRGLYFKVVASVDGQIVYSSDFTRGVAILGDFTAVLPSGAVNGNASVRVQLFRYQFTPFGVIQVSSSGLSYVTNPRAGSVTVSGKDLRQAAGSSSRSLRGKKLTSLYVWPKGGRPNRPSPEVYTQAGFRYVFNGANWNYFESNYATFRREWSGLRTPGYAGKAKSDLPENPHHVYIFRRADGGFMKDSSFNSGSHIYESSEGGPYSSYGGTSYTGAAPTYPTHVDTLYNRAVTKLIAKSGQDIEGNLAQDLVQLGPTARTISNSVSNIARSLAYLRQKNISGAVSMLFGASPVRTQRGFKPGISKTLADNWLALQYGWKPLLQDVFGALRSLADYFAKSQSVVMRMSASSKKEYHTREKLTYGYGTVCGTRTEFIRSVCRLTCHYEISSPLRAFMQQTGFTNPLNLAWEILPFSFVFDWLLPVGPYLSALTAFEGLTFRGGSKTQFTTVETVYSHLYNGHFPPDDERYMLTSSGGESITQVLLDRTPLQGFPEMEGIRFKNPASVTHALNALALLKGFQVAR